ncbi:MAG: PD-(D/E)XK nuclease family protein [Deltaproteobacteria bacterium]|nr:PD-(D/E)XK nuclease family protein [Deltaproteobacteria bacterium]
MEYLSNSQIYLYLQCSLKYKFQYIDRLPKPFKSSGLAFGSAFHSAISWFHKEKMNGNGVTLERLYRIFNADWYSQKLDTDIRYKSGEADMNLVVLAKEILGIYFQKPIKEVKGSEVHFTVPLINPSTGEELGINIEGFFDLIEKDDTIVEFKTSKQTMNQGDADDLLQLTTYGYAYQMLYRKPPKDLKVIDFVKTKKPKMIVLKTKRHKSDYQRFFYLAGKVLKGIQSQIFFPRQSFLCKDCEYEGPCKDWEGN